MKLDNFFQIFSSFLLGRKTNVPNAHKIVFRSVKSLSFRTCICVAWKVCLTYGIKLGSRIFESPETLKKVWKLVNFFKETNFSKFSTFINLEFLKFSSRRERHRLSHFFFFFCEDLVFFCFFHPFGIHFTHI